MSETFYDLLGVAEDASTADIEAAYREAIKEVHPDVSDDVNAGERTKRLNKAKRVLTDEDERARYDRIGHAAYTSGGGSDGRDRDQTGNRSTETDQNTRTEKRRRRGRRRSHRSSRRGPDWATGSSAESGNTGTSDTWSENTGTSTSTRRSGGTGDSRQSTDATGPSRASSGPSWQSKGGAATAGGVDSPSARRQAAAGSTDGPNVDWSWNAWEGTRSWAVREGERKRGRFHPGRLFPVEQPMVLLATTFVLYPVFVFSIVFQPFPLFVRFTVAVCTVLTFAYLLSFPEIAVVVYGVWSVLVPVLFFLIPAVSVFSVAGVIGLSATWVPFGLSVLTLSVLRP